MTPQILCVWSLPSLAPQNRIPVAVRMTFSTKMPFPCGCGAHFPKTCHLPIYAPCKKCSGSSGGDTFAHAETGLSKKYLQSYVKRIFLKNSSVISFKKLQTHLVGCQKCLWRDSRAQFSTPRPRPLPPLPFKLRHDLGLLDQASLKHQGHLRFVKQDHFWSSFIDLDHESHPYIRKTTLFKNKSRLLTPMTYFSILKESVTSLILLSSSKS